MATTAAILDILIKTDTSKATTELRQLDQKMTQAAAGSKRLSDAQRRQGSAFAGSTRSLDNYGRRVAGVDKTNRTLGRSTRGVGTALKSAAGAAIGAAAAYVGIAQAKAAIDATSDLASATIALKKNFQLSIKAASGLGAAFIARGGETSGLASSFIMLSKQVEAAKSTMEGFAAAKGMIKDTSSEKGAKKLAEAIKGVDADAAVSAFRDLGISVKDLQNQNSDKTLFDIANGFENLGNSTRRTVIAAQLFGKTGSKELVPALRQGAEALKEQIALAEKYGATFRGKPIQSIKDLQGAQRELAIAQLGLQVQFTEKIAPALIKVGLAVAGVVNWFTKLFHTTNQMGPSLAEVSKWTSNAAKNFAHWISTTGTLAETLKGLMSLLGQLAKLIFSVGKAFVGAGVAVVNFSKRMIDALKDDIQWIKNAWGNITNFLTAPFEAAVSKIRGFVNTIIGVINTVLGAVGADKIGLIGGGGGGDTSTAGTGQQGRPHPKGKGTPRKSQRGGGIHGSGSGDRIPALLEAGEFVLNRNAVAAVGMHELEAFNKNVSRFQAGGAAAGIGGAISGAGGAIAGALGGGVSAAVGKLPGTGSLPGWIKPVGNFVLAKVGAFIKDKLTPSLPWKGGGPPSGGAGQARVEAVGQWLVSQGFQVSGERLFGGTPTSGHVANSMHYSNRAIDVNHAGNEPSFLIPLYNKLAKGTPRPTELFYQHRGIPGPVPNHMDHLHLGYQQGGLIQKLAKGGVSHPGTTSEGHDLYKYFWPFGIWGDAKGFPNSPTPSAWKTMLTAYVGARNATGNWNLSARKMVALHQNGAKDPYEWLRKWKAGRSGKVQGFQKGGGVPDPAHGSHWIKGGNRWSVDEAATLLWQAGLSRQDASELARVVPSESGGNPRAHNPSGATGLFQILGAVRPGNLYDPRINALNAAIKWRTQGRGAWTGASTGPPGKILMDAIGGNGGAAGTTGTGKDKFQSAFPGIKTSLLQRLHRSLKGPAQRKLQEGIHAARMALGKAKGPAARIAAIQGLNAAKGAKTSYLGALATYQKARKSGTGVRKALEALVTMEQALTAAPEAGDLADADTSALDLENERIRSMNELISQGNLLALQGFQVSASQNPILGLPSDRFPSQTPLSPLLTSLPSAASAPAAGGGGTPKVHVHIHKKKGLDDLIDVRIQGQMKKTARKGNRRLPSGRG